MYDVCAHRWASQEVNAIACPKNVCNKRHSYQNLSEKKFPLVYYFTLWSPIMIMAVKLGSPPLPPPLMGMTVAKKRGSGRVLLGAYKIGADTGSAGGFPSFLPKEVEKIKDPFARSLAQRIERLPVKVCIPFISILHYITGPWNWNWNCT